ncbi:MAG TPA: molybdopterin-binding protein, partial [Anaeromyxobacter sp.]
LDHDREVSRSPVGTRGPTPPVDDVRLRGFADRVSLERALSWVDRHGARLEAEDVGAAGAAGRVPAAALLSPTDLPPADRAGEDGYAVRSGDTVGASAYAPALLRIQQGPGPLAPGGAALVAAGEALPGGADAILAFEVAQATGPSLEVIASVAEGNGIERAGQAARAGAPCAVAGRPLRPHEVGLLAALGVDRSSVVRRPRVRLVVAGAKAGAADANGPMLRALVERDGGAVEAPPAGASVREAILRAVREPGADVVVATGRTGTGPDDEAPLALAQAGELAVHGVALRPGGSAGLGLAGTLPVVLLPGDPLACLCAYEFLAGRLVRRLAGRDPGLPYSTREAEVGRKIVSAIGSVDVCQVRLVEGRVEPLGVAEFGGLASAAGADGFVVVPAALEGYAPGVRVTVHLY